MPTALIIGASGTVGSRLVRELDANDGGISVRLASRRSETVQEWHSSGRDAVVLDLDRPATFAEALAGVDRVFLLTGYTAAMLYQSKTLIDAAQDAGQHDLDPVAAGEHQGSPAESGGQGRDQAGHVVVGQDRLPKDAVWSAFGTSRAEFPMVELAATAGGHVRVGLEDNLYLSRGQFAPSNAALVEKAVSLLAHLDCAPASPAEARAIFGLGA